MGRGVINDSHSVAKMNISSHSFPRLVNEDYISFWHTRFTEFTEGRSVANDLITYFNIYIVIFNQLKTWCRLKMQLV